MTEQTDPEDQWLSKVLEDVENHPFGIVTQRGYEELERKITNFSGRIERRFRRWFITSLIAFSCVSLTSSAALVGFGFLLTQQSNTTRQIQDQRKEAISTACQDQNQRHDGTAYALGLAKDDAIKEHPEQKKEIEKQTQVSLGLIDALAPHQDCAKLVKKSTESKGGP